MNLPSFPTDDLNKLFVIGATALLVTATLNLKSVIDECIVDFTTQVDATEKQLIKKQSLQYDSLITSQRLTYFKSQLKEWEIKSSTESNNQRKQILTDSISILETHANGIQFLLARGNYKIDPVLIMMKENDKIVSTAKKSYYLEIAFASILLVAGFWGWIKKQIIEDQTNIYKDRKTRWEYFPCQSCGMKLIHDLSAEEGTKYCTGCVSNNTFVEPELTYQQLVSRIKENMKARGIKNKVIANHLKTLKTLDRWSDDFRWH